MNRQDPLTDAVVVARFTDAIGNVAENRAARVTILRSQDLTIPLARGINLVTVPVQDPQLRTVRDVLLRIGPSASLILWQNALSGDFISYSADMPTTSPSNGLVRAGAGYVVVMQSAGSLTMRGPAWASASIDLRTGVNLIGLTRVDPSIRRLSDFNGRLGGAFQQAISLNSTTGQFSSYLPEFDPNAAVNRALEIGIGYIIVVRFPRTLTLTGDSPIAQ